MTNPSRSLTTTWRTSRWRTRRSSEAQFLSNAMPVPLPRLSKPRTTNDPEAARGLADDAAGGDPDRSRQFRGRARHLLRCSGHSDRRLRADSAQYRGQRGRRQLARCGHASDRLRSGDPTRPRSPAALSNFDTAFTTSVLWGNNTQPFNNGVQGGSLSLTGTKFPIVSVNDSATFQIGLSKRTATGALAGRGAQRQLVVPEQLVPGLALGLHDESSAHVDPAVARGALRSPARRLAPAGSRVSKPTALRS